MQVRQKQSQPPCFKQAGNHEQKQQKKQKKISLQINELNINLACQETQKNKQQMGKKLQSLANGTSINQIIHNINKKQKIMTQRIKNKNLSIFGWKKKKQCDCPNQKQEQKLKQKQNEQNQLQTNNQSTIQITNNQQRQKQKSKQKQKQKKSNKNLSLNLNHSNFKHIEGHSRYFNTRTNYLFPLSTRSPSCFYNFQRQRQLLTNQNVNKKSQCSIQGEKLSTSQQIFQFQPQPLTSSSIASILTDNVEFSISPKTQHSYFGNYATWNPTPSNPPLKPYPPSFRKPKSPSLLQKNRQLLSNFAYQRQKLQQKRMSNSLDLLPPCSQSSLIKFSCYKKPMTKNNYRCKLGSQYEHIVKACQMEKIGFKMIYGKGVHKSVETSYRRRGYFLDKEVRDQENRASNKKYSQLTFYQLIQNQNPQTSKQKIPKKYRYNAPKYHNIINKSTHNNRYGSSTVKNQTNNIQKYEQNLYQKPNEKQNCINQRIVNKFEQYKTKTKIRNRNGKDIGIDMMTLEKSLKNLDNQFNMKNQQIQKQYCPSQPHCKGKYKSKQKFNTKLKLKQREQQRESYKETDDQFCSWNQRQQECQSFICTINKQNSLIKSKRKKNKKNNESLHKDFKFSCFSDNQF